MGIHTLALVVRVRCHLIELVKLFYIADHSFIRYSLIEMSQSGNGGSGEFLCTFLAVALYKYRAVIPNMLSAQLSVSGSKLLFSVTCNCNKLQW